MLKLLFITNRPDIALLAENVGIDRIWIDLETLGKEQRQKYLNTVKSRHTIDDIQKIAPILTTSDLLVRINPWNPDSKREIDDVIHAGADIIMLPYWKTSEEAENFISHVNGRCKTLLLLETKEAVECLKKTLEIPLIDEIHIGLNDLRLSYGYGNMFLPYASGLLDELSGILRKASIPFGIGGIGQFGIGLSPSPEELIAEHYRLGSTSVILSRTFCNVEALGDIQTIEKTLIKNVHLLRETEKRAAKMGPEELNENHIRVVKALEE